MRSQLLVLIAGAAAAAALFWFTGEGGRAVRRSWSRRHWTAFIVLTTGAAVIGDMILAHYSHVWSFATEHSRGHMLTYGLRSVGALTIGVGVLPVIAGFTVLGSSRGEPRPRERNALTWLIITMFVSFGVYAAAKSAYVTTLGLTEFTERNLIYLARCSSSGRLSFRPSPAVVIALLAGTVLVLYLVMTTPYHMDIPAFFDAPGLAVLRAFTAPSALLQPA
jgi:hypothetical protein